MMTQELFPTFFLENDPYLNAIELEENIASSINSLRDEITNLKDIIIKKLQEDNERLRSRFSNLENLSKETSTNALEQYGMRNNLVLRGYQIPLQMINWKTVISVLGNMYAEVEFSDIEDCDRIGKSDKANSKKPIIRFGNRKYCKYFSALLKIKLEKCVRCNPNTMIFFSENLAMMNQNNACNCRKLKRDGLIFAYFTRDCIHKKTIFW